MAVRIIDLCAIGVLAGLSNVQAFTSFCIFPIDRFATTGRKPNGAVRMPRQPHSVSTVHGEGNTMKIVDEKPTSKAPPFSEAVRVPKYPTARGTTVDSRQIISKGEARRHMSAIRLSHILFATKPLAASALAELRSATISFDSLACQISNCAATRDRHGEIGWVSVDEEGGKNEVLNEILPLAARMKVMKSSCKVREDKRKQSSLKQFAGFHFKMNLH